MTGQLGQVGHWASCRHTGRIVPSYFVPCWAGTMGWSCSPAQPDVVLVPAQARKNRAGPVLVSGRIVVLWAGPWASCFLANYIYSLIMIFPCDCAYTYHFVVFKKVKSVLKMEN
jgi:hypothetical protein